MFNLNQRFKVIRLNDMTPNEQEALTVLYLPIIGRDAFTLYMALYYQREEVGHPLSHLNLFDQLVLDQAKFIAAREKLEALGLVQTFQQDLQQGTQWVYKLFTPNNAQKFLAEPLLASLLAHYLGQDSYAKLVSRYTEKQEEITGNNVTKSFFDVIGSKSFEHIEPSPIEGTDEVALNFAISPNNQLDVDLIGDMLKSNGVTKANLLKNIEELQLYKQLYDLTDLEIVRLIQTTLNADATLNLITMQRKLAQDYHDQQIRPATTAKNTHQMKQPNEAVENTSKPQKAEQALIEAAKTLSPLQFLGKLRTQKNGFVTDAEQKTITKMIKEGHLPDEVLNIVIYQLVVREGKASLSQALVQTIVNDWRQAGISSAQAGLKYLNQRNSRANTTNKQQTTKRNYHNQRSNVKETRPDWEQQQVAPVATNELMAAQNALAELNAKITADKEKKHG